MKKLLPLLILTLFLASCSSRIQNEGKQNAKGKYHGENGISLEEDSMPVNPMNDFGMTASNVFFYYSNLPRATKFYTETLGLNVAADYGFAKILQVAPTSFITLVDETKGMHKSSEPKSVAIALITDQLDEWFNYIQKMNVEIKSPYNPKDRQTLFLFYFLPFYKSR